MTSGRTARTRPVAVSVVAPLAALAEAVAGFAN